MSERADNSQLELFSSQSKIYGQTNSSLQGRFIFRHIKDHERTILIIVAILITGLVAFSLGVEKGKGYAGNSEFVPATVKYDDALIAPQPPLRIKTKKKETIAPAVPDEDNLQYTIQLASYQNNSSAKKEAETLKKKGLLPLVSSKGRYTVLCVGNFTGKRNALALLPELKKRYNDCFIRKL